jgi:hypothetical protein
MATSTDSKSIFKHVMEKLACHKTTESSHNETPERTCDRREHTQQREETLRIPCKSTRCSDAIEIQHREPGTAKRSDPETASSTTLCIGLEGLSVDADPSKVHRYVVSQWQSHLQAIC